HRNLRLRRDRLPGWRRRRTSEPAIGACGITGRALIGRPLVLTQWRAIVARGRRGRGRPAPRGAALPARRRVPRTRRSTTERVAGARAAGAGLAGALGRFRFDLAHGL